MGRTDPELILRTIVESIAIPGTYNAFYRRELWLIMTPEHAVTIADAGWSKRDVQTGSIAKRCSLLTGSATGDYTASSMRQCGPAGSRTPLPTNRLRSPKHLIR